MKKWLLFTMLAAALTAAAQQPDRRQRSAAERQLRQQRFMERLDSMVASGDFQFLPVSMEWGPRGGSQIINDFYYYIGIFKNRLQVHIPVVIGRAMTYNAVVNFDTDKMTGFRTQRNDSGWKVSFAATDNTGTAYTFVFTIYDQTGHGHTGYGFEPEPDAVFGYDRRERQTAENHPSRAADEKGPG